MPPFSSYPQSSKVLTGFWTDLGGRMNVAVVTTMSEFGRTAHQKETGHESGHGNCFQAMGGNIKGGRVLGDYLGLPMSNSSRTMTWQ
ncbi:MAG: DUF1501 domain-containing protein [Proteobacteria bacterium]|nr:MAG: DUF1501 domain-containing protein [Pseudomonadota bacterium]